MRTVYLVTTEGCEACKIMENNLMKVYGNNLYTFTPEVIDFSAVPSWISVNVSLNDFPTLIFVEDNVIKYHCSGTKTIKAIQSIITDIGFN